MVPHSIPFLTERVLQPLIVSSLTTGKACQSVAEATSTLTPSSMTTEIESLASRPVCRPSPDTANERESAAAVTSLTFCDRSHPQTRSILLSVSVNTGSSLNNSGFDMITSTATHPGNNNPQDISVAANTLDKQMLLQRNYYSWNPLENVYGALFSPSTMSPTVATDAIGDGKQEFAFALPSVLRTLEAVLAEERDDPTEEEPAAAASPVVVNDVAVPPIHRASVGGDPTRTPAPASSPINSVKAATAIIASYMGDFIGCIKELEGEVELAKGSCIAYADEAGDTDESVDFTLSLPVRDWLGRSFDDDVSVLTVDSSFGAVCSLEDEDDDMSIVGGDDVAERTGSPVTASSAAKNALNDAELMGFLVGLCS
jgi:hypothetical protein